MKASRPKTQHPLSLDEAMSDLLKIKPSHRQAIREANQGRKTRRSSPIQTLPSYPTGPFSYGLSNIQSRSAILDQTPYGALHIGKTVRELSERIFFPLSYVLISLRRLMNVER